MTARHNISVGDGAHKRQALSNMIDVKLPKQWKCHLRGNKIDTGLWLLQI